MVVIITWNGLNIFEHCHKFKMDVLRMNREINFIIQTTGGKCACTMTQSIWIIQENRNEVKLYGKQNSQLYGND